MNVRLEKLLSAGCQHWSTAHRPTATATAVGCDGGAGGEETGLLMALPPRGGVSAERADETEGIMVISK